MITWYQVLMMPPRYILEMVLLKMFHTCTFFRGYKCPSLGWVNVLACLTISLLLSQSRLAPYPFHVEYTTSAWVPDPDNSASESMLEGVYGNTDPGCSGTFHAAGSIILGSYSTSYHRMVHMRKLLAVLSSCDKADAIWIFFIYVLRNIAASVLFLPTGPVKVWRLCQAWFIWELKNCLTPWLWKLKCDTAQFIPCLTTSYCMVLWLASTATEDHCRMPVAWHI